MENGSRLEASIDAMKRYFPNLSLSVKTTRSGTIAVWEGRVQPVQSPENLHELLDDIHKGREVKIIAGGKVEHHPSCFASHQQYEWFDRLDDLRVSYELGITYGGSQIHPKAFVPNLIIPPHGPKHLNGDGSICPYAPWEQVWLWDRDTVVDYLGHALIWLIKWTVWCQSAIWIGPDIGHDPAFLVRTIGRNQECRCGSGKKYKKCHLSYDEEMARAVHR